MIDFIHVGIQKTGSTWLQTGYFRQHPQLQVIGGAILDRPITRLIQDLYDVPDGRFATSRWRIEFERQVEQLKIDGRWRENNAITGISNEQLAGHQFDPDASTIIARRLYDLFGAVKIILILRHPLTWIPSAYAQAVKGGSLTLRFSEILTDPAYQKRIALRMNYSRLIESYVDVFGNENVLVLPYELLREDNFHFLKCINDFLGCEPIIDDDFTLESARRNERLSIPMLQLLRQINKLDLAIEKITHRAKWRIVSRAIRYVARHNPLNLPLSTMSPLTTKDLKDFPLFYEVLQDERYQFWQGDLARFNYRFDWHL